MLRANSCIRLIRQPNFSSMRSFPDKRLDQRMRGSRDHGEFRLKQSCDVERMIIQFHNSYLTCAIHARDPHPSAVKKRTIAPVQTEIAVVTLARFACAVD